MGEISDSKGLISLKPLGSKRDDYFGWNVKRINISARFYQSLELDNRSKFKDVIMKINQKWSTELDYPEEDIIDHGAVEQMVVDIFTNEYGFGGDKIKLCDNLSDQVD